MTHDEFPGKLNTSIPRNQNHMLAGKKMTGNSWKQSCLGSRSLGTEFLSSKFTEPVSVTESQEKQHDKVGSLVGTGPMGDLVGIWQRAGLPLQETRPRITVAGIQRELYLDPGKLRMLLKTWGLCVDCFQSRFYMGLRQFLEI